MAPKRKPAEEPALSRPPGWRFRFSSVRTPREFVEGLREPDSARWAGTNVKAARLAEIDGALAAGLAHWGAGGEAFIRQARTQALCGRFEEWLDSLPAMPRKSKGPR
jgi:hypothetical protein